MLIPTLLKLVISTLERSTTVYLSTLIISVVNLSVRALAFDFLTLFASKSIMAIYSLLKQNVKTINKITLLIIKPLFINDNYKIDKKFQKRNIL